MACVGGIHFVLNSYADECADVRLFSSGPLKFGGMTPFDLLARLSLTNLRSCLSISTQRVMSSVASHCTDLAESGIAALIEISESAGGTLLLIFVLVFIIFGSFWPHVA